MKLLLEKLMKAELIRRRWKLIKTRDLQRLADELSLHDPGLYPRSARKPTTCSASLRPMPSVAAI